MRLKRQCDYANKVGRRVVKSRYHDPKICRATLYISACAEKRVLANRRISLHRKVDAGLTPRERNNLSAHSSDLSFHLLRSQLEMIRGRKSGSLRIYSDASARPIPPTTMLPKLARPWMYSSSRGSPESVAHDPRTTPGTVKFASAGHFESSQSMRLS